MVVNAWYFVIGAAAHEMAHIDDYRNWGYEGAKAYAQGKEGCYTKNQANCWRDLMGEAALMYFYIADWGTKWVRDDVDDAASRSARDAHANMLRLLEDICSASH
jgi:hypothetical protein